ncbi:MAG: T9SS type A sorting domain-containing protein [Paludibacter sp.]|nr:T9SS type A sorting domain-containing protein [Paludibacter sp.]
MKKVILIIFIGFSSQIIGFSQTTVSLRLPNNCDITVTSSDISLKDYNDLILSPNPSNGYFELKTYYSDIIGLANINIYSSNGLLVYVEKIYCNGFGLVKKLRLNSIAPGNYILYFQTDKDVRNVKLIIK